MRCHVCRREYFTIHECPGELYMGNVSKPDGGFLLRYYLGEALRIFKLDNLAIRRIEHDPGSIYYSIPILYLAVILAILPDLLPIFFDESTKGAGPNIATLFIVAILAFIFPILLGTYLLVQVGILHGLIRWFFNGQGSYARVLRPFIFSSIFLIILSVVPVVGNYIAYWSLVIYAWIFEEVEGINRIQAIGIGILGGILLSVFAAVIASIVIGSLGLT